MLHQGQRSAGRSNVAANYIHLWVVLLYPAYAVQHAFAVAVGCINNDYVHASSHQLFNTFFSAIAHAHGCTYAQFPVNVFAGPRVFRGFLDVLNSNQAFQRVVCTHHQHALQAVLVHQGFGLLQAVVFGYGDQTLSWGHDVGNRLVQFGFETQVAVRDNANHLAILDNRQARNFVLLCKSNDLANGEFRLDRDRVAKHARLMAFYFGHLGRLLRCCQVLVNNTDTTFLCHGNGQPGFSHRVHGGRHQRNVQADVSGQLGRQGCVFGKNV